MNLKVRPYICVTGIVTATDGKGMFSIDGSQYTSWAPDVNSWEQFPVEAIFNTQRYKNGTIPVPQLYRVVRAEGDLIEIRRDTTGRPVCFRFVIEDIVFLGTMQPPASAKGKPSLCLLHAVFVILTQRPRTITVQNPWQIQVQLQSSKYSCFALTNAKSDSPTKACTHKGIDWIS